MKKDFPMEGGSNIIFFIGADVDVDLDVDVVTSVADDDDCGLEDSFFGGVSL